MKRKRVEDEVEDENSPPNKKRKLGESEIPHKLVLGGVPFEQVIESKIPEGKTIIMTHNGKFHADETLACAFLSFLPKYQKNTVIVRVHHKEVGEKMNSANIVTDIGGVYDGKKFFDHHQKSFNDSFNENFTTRLASCGLIWKHFGKEVISAIAEQQNIGIKDKTIEKLHEKFYRGFVEHVDANDNGISVAETPRFSVSTALPQRVGNLNPAWNEENVDLSKRWIQAVELCRTEVLENLNYSLFHWLPARQLVERFYQKRFLDGTCMELEQTCPWRAHVFDLEEEEKEEKETKDEKKEPLLFVIFKDQRNANTWRYMIVGVKDSRNFDMRIYAPPELCGLRGEELSKKAGIEGLTFMHQSHGFTGGCKTKEGLLKLLQLIREKGKREK